MGSDRETEVAGSHQFLWNPFVVLALALKSVTHGARIIMVLHRLSLMQSRVQCFALVFIDWKSETQQM